MRGTTRPIGRRYSFFKLLILVIAGACAEESLVTPPAPPPAPPTKATVLVTIITTGSQPDSSYVLVVDGTLFGQLSSNAQVELPLPPGTHTFELGDLADNCRATVGTRFSVEIGSSGRSAVTFSVACPKLATLDISVATTGVSLDPDGYRLTLDTLAIQPFGLQDHLHLDRIWPGPYTVQLSDVAINCGDPSGSSRSLNVGDGQAAAVSFAVVCQLRPDDTPGPKLVVASSKGGSGDDLEIIDLAGGLRQPLTNDVGDDQGPEFSPDGNKILFVSWLSGTHTSKLKILDRATRDETTLPTSGVERAIWSPDGSQIAFVRAGSIYLMAADGSNERRLTSGHNDRDPYWSPDGSQIAISRDQTVALVQVANGDVTTLVEDRLAGPWAPDGRHLIVNVLECDFYYGCYYGGPVPSDLAIFDVQSKAEVRLTQTPLVAEWSPVWSPDGQWVYYITAPNGNPDVFVTGLGGGEPVNLTNSTSVSERWVTLGQVGAPSASRSALRSRHP